MSGLCVATRRTTRLLLVCLLACQLSCLSVVLADANAKSSANTEVSLPIKTGQLVRLTPRHVTPLCANFTLGTDDFEAYGPDWQHLSSPQLSLGKYPSNVDCVRIVQAPPNRIVKLQFTGYFEIEDTGDCLYDFLEIRDGPFGYSPPLGRLCGSSFPSDVYSTQRFLWLRFHTDDMLEYRGFQIIVSFVPRARISAEQQLAEESQFCLHSLDALGFPSVSVSSNSFNQRYIDYLNSKGKNIDCTLEVVTDERTRLTVLVENIGELTGTRCDDGFVTIYDGSTATPKTDRLHYCSNTSLNEPFLLTSNHLFVRVVARTLTIPTFRLSLAAGMPGSCDAYYNFDCINSICIPQSLVCDGLADCPSKLDEVGCDAGETPALSAIRSAVVDTEAKTSDPVKEKDSTSIILIVVGACIGIVVVGASAQVVLMVCERRRGGGKGHQSRPIRAVQSEPSAGPETVTLVTRASRAPSEAVGSHGQHGTIGHRSTVDAARPLHQQSLTQVVAADCEPTGQPMSILRNRELPLRRDCATCGSLRMLPPRRSELPAANVGNGIGGNTRQLMSRSITMPPSCHEESDAVELGETQRRIGSAAAIQTTTPTAIAFYEI